MIIVLRNRGTESRRHRPHASCPAHVHRKGASIGGSQDKPAALDPRHAREALERIAARCGGRSGLHPRGPGSMNPVRASRAYMRRASNTLLPLVCLALFLVILDDSLVNVGLPSIRNAVCFCT